MGFLLRSQLPQHVLQNSAVLEVLDLLRRVDADPGLELLFRSIGSGGNHIQRASALELRSEQRLETREIEHFLAGQSKRFRALLLIDLEPHNPPAHEIATVNALEALGNHHAYAEQIRYL